MIGAITVVMETRAHSVVSKTLLTAIFTSATLYSQLAVSASANWAVSVPVPPQATLEIISENVEHNGMSMSVGRIVSTEPLETNLDFYRTTWSLNDSTETPGYVEQSFDNWIAISRLENGFNTVIQFDQNAEVSGSAIVSVMSIDQSSTIGFNSSSHPGNAELLSSTRTHDDGRDATVQVLRSGMSIDSVKQFYASHFRRHGWNLVSDRSVMDSHVLMFNKKLEKAEVYLGQDPGGSTLVVINQVVRDE